MSGPNNMLFGVQKAKLSDISVMPERMHVIYAPNTHQPLVMPEQDGVKLPLLKSNQFLAYQVEPGLYIWQTSATDCTNCVGSIELLAEGNPGIEALTRLHSVCRCTVVEHAQAVLRTDTVNSATTADRCDWAIYPCIQGALYTINAVERQPSILHREQLIIAHTGATGAGSHLK